MRKLYAIYTVNNFMPMIYEPFAKKFEEKNPEFKVFNIMDDSLLVDTREYGEMTPVIASRMLNYCKAAEASGAEGIIVTCTSVNKATAMIRPFLNIPIINIEEPVAEMAVRNGKKIGVLATLPTSPAAIGRVIMEKAAEMGKEVELVNCVVDGAFDVYCAGDIKKHDKMVCDKLYELSKKVDVIAFAQVSMSKVMFNPDDIPVPVYMIGDSGFDRIGELMEKKEINI